MNNCTFTGYLTDTPDIETIDGVAYTTFRMVTYNYVKKPYTYIYNYIYDSINYLFNYLPSNSTFTPPPGSP